MRPKASSPTSSSRTRGEALHRMWTPCVRARFTSLQAGQELREGPGDSGACGLATHRRHAGPTPTPRRARMSAAQCLAHPWLNNLAEKAKRCNRRLKSQVLLKKYLMKRRWKVLLGWGWEREGLQGRKSSWHRIPGPTSPALAGSADQAWPRLENRAGFSPFVLGWLRALHPRRGVHLGLGLRKRSPTSSQASFLHVTNIY